MRGPWSRFWSAETDTKLPYFLALGLKPTPKTTTSGGSGTLLEEMGMARLKRVRVIEKVREKGAYRFVSLKQNGSRYVWDDRPGTYYLEW